MGADGSHRFLITEMECAALKEAFPHQACVPPTWIRDNCLALFSQLHGIPNNIRYYDELAY